MMNTIIIVCFSMMLLVSCAETWTGVKKDTKTITRSVGDAGNHLGKKIGEVFSGDNKKEGEE